MDLSSMPDLKSVEVGDDYPKEILDFVEENASKSLYICTVERLLVFRGDTEPDESCRYTIQRIGLRDLFCFKYDITELPSKSSSDSLLQQLVSVQKTDMPSLAPNMSCSFFGSKVFLAGGEPEYKPTSTSDSIFFCETVSSLGKPMDNPKFIPGKKFKCDGGFPFVLEINGSLYIMGRHVQCSPFLQVYDAAQNEWSELPDTLLPLYFDYVKAYAVVGTVIFISCYSWHHDTEVLLCYDVSLPDEGWLVTETLRLPFSGKALVLDLEGFEDRKILLATDAANCLGFYIMKWTEGTLSSIQHVGSTCDMVAQPDNYTLTYLGDRKVCFVRSSYKDAGMEFHICTFRFTYMPHVPQNYILAEEPAKRRVVEVTDSGSRDDVLFNILGELTFKYGWSDWTEGAWGGMGCSVQVGASAVF